MCAITTSNMYMYCVYKNSLSSVPGTPPYYNGLTFSLREVYGGDQQVTETVCRPIVCVVCCDCMIVLTSHQLSAVQIF